MSKKQPAKKLKTETEKQQPRKAYQFRLYPTRKQINVLERWLGLCCDTYNAALDERKSAYRMAGLSLSYAHQCAELPECKEVCPELGEVPAQVFQDAVKRVARAYDDFFRRVEQGQKPGFPRFKSRFRYDSLTFKQYKNSFNVFESAKKNKATLVLAKLGHVKMVMHRPIKGTPKTAIVKRTPTGKWFVSISVEIAEEEAGGKRLPACTEAVGIDVGLKSFAYLSTGEEIANPRFFRTEEAALARAQRKLAQAPKGTKQREKRRKVVARVHERTRNRRKNFLEQETRISYRKVCKPVDEQAESFQKPTAWSRGSRHQGKGFPSRKKPPVGPLSGRVAAHTMPAAPCSTGRPPAPPISVATQPGQTALTRMPVPASSAARIRVSALSEALEMLYAGVPPPI